MSAFEGVPVEAVRGYWDSRPCNIRHSFHPVGSPEYFRDVTYRKHFVEPHIEGFAQFPDWRNKRVLEIGCGIGTAAEAFAKNGAIYTGVDLSGESIRIARFRAKVMGFTATFMEANAEELCSKVSGQFDLIYSFGVIHHTPHPDQVLREARKLLAPNGVLKIMVYNKHSLKSWRIVKGRFWKFDALLANESEAQTGCPVTYTYTRRSLARLLRSTGFEPSQMWVDHIFPWRVKDYVSYRYKKSRWVRVLPKRWFRRLERSAGWHLMAEATPC